MTNTFEHTYQMSVACQLRISGIWQTINGELQVYVELVEYSHSGLIWDSIPQSFINWIDGMDKIDELAYAYVNSSCVNADHPDTTTDLQQEQHINDLKTQEKLS